MDEHRSIVRRRISAPAALSGRGARFDCVVVDISEQGARIRLVRPAFLPDSCVLASMAIDTAVPCRVMWRRGLEAGLRFAAPVVVKEGRSGRPFGTVGLRRR